MIYTAITGQRDKPRTDIKVFGEYNYFSTPVMNSRIYKVLAHLFVPGQSIWVDGNIFPKSSEETIFEDIPWDCDLATFKHPARTRATQEARALLAGKIGSESDINDWQQNQNRWGLGLMEDNVICRRDNERVRRFNERWWALLCRWPWRDQLTVNEALRDAGVRVHTFDWGDIHKRQHKHFEYRPH